MLIAPANVALVVRYTDQSDNPRQILYLAYVPPAGRWQEQWDDTKSQIIKLTQELTNKNNLAGVQKLAGEDEKGQISPASYAKKLANIEVAGEINKIKVAAEIGYKYKGTGMDAVNNLIDQYSKDNTIDLTSRVLPSTTHLKEYENQAKEEREAYLKEHPKSN